MYKEITLEEAKGKTITNYSFSFSDDQLILVFSDNTFTTIGFDIGIFGHEDVMIIQDKLALLKFGDKNLIIAGIITSEEMQSEREKHEKIELKKREDWERQEYLKLKDKYKE